MAGSSVAESWGRINAWLQANDLPRPFWPRPGVLKPTILTAEAAMGLQLPADVRESYRTHDGCNKRDYLILFHGGFLLPLEDVVATCAELREIGQFNSTMGLHGTPVGPIRADYWNPRWVPLTCDWQSDTVAIDLDPAEGGSVGQVILHSREGETCVLASSWREWLNGYANALEAGEYRLEVVYEWLAVVRKMSDPDDEWESEG